MKARLQIAGFAYHDVTDDPHASGFPRPGALPYKHTRIAFAQHLAQLATSPATPGPVGAIDFTRPGRHVLLTFDDGGRGALYIAEELSRRGWTGHFFVVTDRIGSRAFLRGSEVRAVRDLGHVIGSHSHTHPNIFHELSVAEMLAEWSISTDILSQLLGEPCATAAVPGGHVAPSVIRAAAAAGVRYVFTCEPVLAPVLMDDCWVLGRYLVKTHTPLLRLQELAQFRGWASARVVRLVKHAVTRSAPGLYRRYVDWQAREWAQPMLPAAGD